jgi:hypothetical protein
MIQQCAEYVEHGPARLHGRDDFALFLGQAIICRGHDAWDRQSHVVISAKADLANYPP